MENLRQWVFHNDRGETLSIVIAEGDGGAYVNLGFGQKGETPKWVNLIARDGFLLPQAAFKVGQEWGATMPYFFEITNKERDVLKIEGSPDGGPLYGVVTAAKPLPPTREELHDRLVAQLRDDEWAAERAERVAKAKALEQIDDAELRQRAVGFRFVGGDASARYERWDGQRWVYHSHQPPPEMGR